MTHTADQRAFLIRLDVADNDLVIAAQTIPGGVRAYLEARVAAYGASNIYARAPDGKHTERWGEALDRLFPAEKKVRRAAR